MKLYLVVIQPTLSQVFRYFLKLGLFLSQKIPNFFILILVMFINLSYLSLLQFFLFNDLSKFCNLVSVLKFCLFILRTQSSDFIREHGILLFEKIASLQSYIKLLLFSLQFFRILNTKSFMFHNFFLIDCIKQVRLLILVVYLEI